MDRSEAYLVREGLSAVGAEQLPEQARQWVARRVDQHGYHAVARNLGGLLCLYPHHHGTDGRCLMVNGRPLRRFPDLKTAAGVLVATASRATATTEEPASDLPVSLDGFRSTHPQDGEVGFLPLVVGPAAAYWAYKYVTGPSEDAERRFRDLSADWEAFEKAGITDAEFARLAEDVRAWRAFRDLWRAGEPEVEALTAQEATANRVRAELCAQRNSPRCGQNLRGGDIEDARGTYKAASWVDRQAKEASKTTADAWGDVPWQVKAGGAAVFVLVALSLVRDLTRSR